MPITMMTTRRWRASVGLLVLATGALVVSARIASTQAPHFYDDDPITRVPESQDASKAQPYSIEQLYEQVFGLFVTPGRPPSNTRAGNINTIDEVPDSSWFINKIGTVPVTAEELARGPIVGAPPDPSKWVVFREKTSGAHPGFTARDGKGETWFLEFDPPYFPEGATAAVVIATKIFWALGYNQVESFITTFDPKNLEFDPKATLKRPNGKRSPFTRDDINQILETVARKPDGTYRVVAGRLVPGKILGNYLYEGTRPDDPNDLVPHEHRRELRAIRVFGAWTNLTDWKAANTLDALAMRDGHMVVKHLLQDVGSTFGLNNDKYEWDLGYEHFYQGDTLAKRFFSFGFALSPWQTIPYNEDSPATGKFEGDRFDPRKWRPQIATQAYMEMRDDDAFWAAQKIMAFTDDLIRAAVHTGEYSDPKAEKLVADVLIQRRQKIASTYLTAVNPIVSLKFDGNRLTFENAAEKAGVAKGPTTYRALWATFDNASGTTRPLGDTQSTTTTLEAPSGLPTGTGSYIEVSISADNPTYPTWKQAIRTHFRRQADGWKLVGLIRTPDAPGPAPTGATPTTAAPATAKPATAKPPAKP